MPLCAMAVDAAREVVEGEDEAADAGGNEDDGGGGGIAEEATDCPDADVEEPTVFVVCDAASELAVVEALAEVKDDGVAG